MVEENYLKQVKLNEATVSLRMDGIVHVLFHKNIVLDVPLQVILLDVYNQITEKKKHPFIFEAFDGVRVTKEAKDYAMQIEDDAPGYAYAIVASSLTYKIFANFYLKERKPKMPSKVFNIKEDAVAWLTEHINKEEGVSATS